MTPWFRLALVHCVLLCLFLGLTRAVGWNYQPVVSAGSSFYRSTKATSDSPTSFVVRQNYWRSIWLALDHSDPWPSIVV